MIKEEILAIRDKYGDDRRTSIGFDEFDISMEDLIPREDVVITMTKLGYIKRMSNDTFKAQNRGGKGIKGMQKLDEDYVEELFMSNTHHYIMFFTSTGRVYRLKGYEIPESSRTSRGTAIINLLQLMPGEKISAVIPIEKYDDDSYLVMATKKGLVKENASAGLRKCAQNRTCGHHIKRRRRADRGEIYRRKTGDHPGYQVRTVYPVQ